MGKRAVVYVRISFDKRRGSLSEGIGVREQESECRKKIAELRGYDVVAVFVDNDVSAYSGKKRPDYDRMLTLLRAGKADVVLCWHTDRLHRDNTELEDYIKVVEPRDILTETVKAGMLDLNTPVGRMVARNLCTIARYESEHRAERVALARERQAREGKYGGGSRRPYGFLSDGVTVDETEARVIRRMAQAVLSGVSLRSIARDLREKNVPTSTGTQWYPSGVRSVLLRPRNAGFMVHRETSKKSPVYTDDDIVGKAPWDAILPEDQWRAVVAKLTNPQRNTNHTGQAVKYLGSGIYLCPCGKPLGISPGRRNGEKRYGCRESGSTGHVTISMEPLDRLVQDVLIEKLSRPDAADLVVPGESGVDIAALRIELATHRQRLDEIAEDYNADRITRAQMLSMTESRRAKIDDTEVSLASVTEVSPLAPLISAENVREAWEGLTLGEKRAALQALLTVRVLRAGRGNQTPVEERVRFDKGQPRKRPV
jgi:DNA invertase Pin-like site-specific DNA recombinase